MISEWVSNYLIIRNYSVHFYQFDPFSKYPLQIHCMIRISMSSKEANDIHTLWPYILWHFYNVAFFFHPNYFEVALTPFYLLLRKRKPSVRLPDPHGYDDMNYIWTRQVNGLEHAVNVTKPSFAHSSYWQHLTLTKQ